MVLNRSRITSPEALGSDLLSINPGPFGFEAVRSYRLTGHRSDSPLKLMRALDSTDLTFAVVDPFLLFAQYRIDISREVFNELHCRAMDKLAALVTVGIPDKSHVITANLRGPIVINVNRRLGRQVLLVETDYSPRHPIAAHFTGCGEQVHLRDNW